MGMGVYAHCGLGRIRARLWPSTPATIADDLTRLRHDNLRASAPFLYALVILSIALGISIDDPVPSFAANFAMPIVIIAACTYRLVWWLSVGQHAVNLSTMNRRVRGTIYFAVCIASLSGVWAIGSWIISAETSKNYYPMLFAVCAFASIFCVSTIRTAAVGILVTAIAPVIGIMWVFGETIDRMAGVLVLVAALFLIRLIHQHHNRLVAQLLLEHRMRTLAHTDELTGLLNRRALKNEMNAVIDAGQPLALILLDLDGFKAVNDQYGHGAGDILLQEIALRLCGAASEISIVARLGGDEFALLLPGGDQAAARALADRVLLTLVRPISLPAATVRIGASAGISVAACDTSIATLFTEADGALYAAKRGPLPDLQRTLKRAPAGH